MNLDIIFRQRHNGSWRWQNRMCTIEVVYNDSMWVAICDPRLSRTEEADRPKLSAEDHNRGKAVELLLKDKNIAITFGLCHGQHIPLIKLFDAIKIRWKPKKQYERQVEHNQELLMHNPCPNENNPNVPECDGSRDCFFCASHGRAYFINWDD